MAFLSLHLFLHKFEIMLSHMLVRIQSNSCQAPSTLPSIMQTYNNGQLLNCLYKIKKKSTEAAVSIVWVGRLLFWIIIFLCSKVAPTEHLGEGLCFLPWKILRQLTAKIHSRWNEHQCEDDFLQGKKKKAAHNLGILKTQSFLIMCNSCPYECLLKL